MLECVWFRTSIPKEEQPPPRRYHTGIKYNDNLYVFGGYAANSEPLSDFYCLDMDKMKWNKVQETGEFRPQARYGHVAAVHNDKLYIYGGNIRKWNGAIADFEVFDFKTGAWSKIDAPNGPGARYYHTAVTFNDKMYVFGGCQTNKIYYKDLYAFDFATQTWSELKISLESAPRDRAGHTSFLIGEKLYIYGGFGDDGGYSHFNDMHFIDLANPVKWEKVNSEGQEDFLPATGRCLTNVVIGEKCYIFGGYDGKVPTRTFHRFMEGKWRVIPLWLALNDDEILSTSIVGKGTEPIPRYGHCSVVGKDNVITIFGGTGSTYLSDVIQIDTTDV